MFKNYKIFKKHKKNKGNQIHGTGRLAKISKGKNYDL